MRAIDNNQMDLYEFGPFRLDSAKRLLTRDGRPIPLQPKTFDTLLVLVRNSQKVVLKDDLLNAVWADTFVEESNLTQNVFMLRKALGDTDAERRYIITVPGRGYRFAESVRAVAQPEHTPAESQLPRTQIGLATLPTSLDPYAVAPASHLPPSLPAPSVPAIPTARLRSRITPAALLLAALFTIALLLWRHYSTPQAASPPRIMLAVMPFQNLTGDPEQEFFADGVTEEITTQLGRLRPEQLGVIARTSVMPYKRTNERTDQIGRELAVQYLLEGSFRRTADRVRITAQLIRVNDQSHLWAQDYDRSVQDVLTMQDDVAASVAREIQIRLTPQQLTALHRPRPVDPQAYEDYLKGRFFWNQRTENGFRKAIEHFDAAIAKDPNYARAYAGLADVYVLMGGYAYAPQSYALPKAKAAALKALALDDQLPEAYTSLGLILMQSDWNWLDSQKNYQRALELDPNYAVAHHWYGDGYLAIVGRSDDSIAELRKAHELDPLSSIIQVDLAKQLCFAGHQAQALEQFQKILEVRPDYAQALYYLSQCYTKNRDYPQAIAVAEKMIALEPNPTFTAWLAYNYALSGRRTEALRIADQLREASRRTFIDPPSIAHIYIALGDHDQAFFWLEKGFNERSPYMLSLRHGWLYDPVRADPRYLDLARRVGLP